MTAFRIGFASSDITPPVGTPLGGYLGRPGFEAQGIHDPLFAKAIAVTDDSQLALLYSLDLLGLTPERSLALAQEAADACGIEPEQVVIACTHTHSGPSTLPLRGMPLVDEAYFQALGRAMRAAGKAAFQAQKPARMEAALGRSQVGVSRRSSTGQSIELKENPAGIYDDTLLVLRFSDAQSGKPLGVLSSYGCHLTALGGRNLLISAEWAGLAMADLQQRLGCPAVFFNGAFGNVNPRGRDETWKRTEEIAAQFARDCLAALEAATEAPPSPLVLQRSVVDLPLAPLAPEDEIHRLRTDAIAALQAAPVDEPSRRVAEVRRQYAEAVQRRRISCEIEESRPAELAGLRMGDVGLIGVPGEVFAEYAIELRADSPLPYFMLLGNVGAELGYFPTRRAFSEGGYEPSSHIFFCDQGYSPRIEDELLAGARALLRRLAAS